MNNQQTLHRSTVIQNTTNTLPWQAQSLSERTIPSLVTEFLRTKKSSQTKKAYQQDIVHFFEQIQITTAWQLISVPIYDLSNTIINYTESFKKSEEYREDRILNPRTINRKAYALSSFFEFLVANYWYPRNPVKVFIPYSTPSRTSTDDMSADELNAFWGYVQDHTHALQASVDTKPKALLSSYQQLLIIGFLMLSLRRNEVANLRRDDRDTKKSVMTVFGKWQKVKHLPLPSKVGNYLQTYQTLKTTHSYNSDYIFSPINNNRSWDYSKPISGTYIFKLVQTLTQKLKVEGLVDADKKITPHSFRTTFVKLALDKNCSDIEIMNATWHGSAQMVKYYDARSPIEVNAANTMNDIF